MNRALNLIGLFPNLVGVLILFRYGMQFHVPTGGAVSLITEQLDRDRTRATIPRPGVYRSRLLNRGNVLADGGGLASPVDSRTSVEGYGPRISPRNIFFISRWEGSRKFTQNYAKDAKPVRSLGDLTALLSLTTINAMSAMRSNRHERRRNRDCQPRRPSVSRIKW
jgi:hypothetical protein